MAPSKRNCLIGLKAGQNKAKDLEAPRLASGRVTLKIAMYAIYFQLAFLIVWSFRWCVNPLKAFEGLKVIKEQGNKLKIISNLAKGVDKEGLSFKDQIKKKVEQLTKAFNALELISKKIGSTPFLFSWFLLMWGFVLTNVIIGSAGILRVLHLTTVGGVFPENCSKANRLTIFWRQPSNFLEVMFMGLKLSPVMSLLYWDYCRSHH